MIARSVSSDARRALSRCLLTALLCAASLPGAAEEREPQPGDWRRFDSTYLQLGYGAHWDDSDDYRGIPALIGLEWSRNNRAIAGISLFNNSFGQFSQYVYYGRKWQLSRWDEALTVKLSGGIIYGYVGEFEDRLKPSWNGFVPAIIPSLGWKKRNWGFDVAILGGAGVMLLVGRDVGD
ncbi:MAG: hypothetical protein AAGG11_18850 [Pseudomonadota bacterium]